MKLTVVDFAGHGFQAELSRALARRGHQVAHTWCSTNVTPHGDLTSRDGVQAIPVTTSGTFEKYRLLARLRSELEYGLRTARILWHEQPEAVLTSNVPLLSLAVIALATRRRHARWVLWLQDVQTGLATQSLRGPARIVAWASGALERRLIRSADEVVVISDDFVPAVRDAKANEPTIIENWAVLSELTPMPKDNAWAREHDVTIDEPVFVYAGTLGRKHPPELLVALAEELEGRAQLIVATEGEGADTLSRQVQDRGLGHVTLLPFQPHDRLGEMLSAADVLVAVLDGSAGSFSVPSKVLSYLCAQRALLVAMPPENRASRLVSDLAAAGVAVAPTAEDIRKGAAQLLSEPAKWDDYGRRAREYAEVTFDVDEKAIQFEALLTGSAAETPAKEQQ